MSGLSDWCHVGSAPSHAHTCSHTHTCPHALTHTHTHTHPHSQVLTQAHKPTHAHSHTLICAHQRNFSLIPPPRTALIGGPRPLPKAQEEGLSSGLELQEQRRPVLPGGVLWGCLRGSNLEFFLVTRRWPFIAGSAGEDPRKVAETAFLGMCHAGWPQFSGRDATGQGYQGLPAAGPGKDPSRKGEGTTGAPPALLSSRGFPVPQVWSRGPRVAAPGGRRKTCSLPGTFSSSPTSGPGRGHQLLLHLVHLGAALIPLGILQAWSFPASVASWLLWSPYPHEPCGSRGSVPPALGLTLSPPLHPFSVFMAPFLPLACSRGLRGVSVSWSPGLSCTGPRSTAPLRKIPAGPGSRLPPDWLCLGRFLFY